LKRKAVPAGRGLKHRDLVASAGPGSGIARLPSRARIETRKIWRLRPRCCGIARLPSRARIETTWRRRGAQRRARIARLPSRARIETACPAETATSGCESPGFPAGRGLKHPRPVP